MQRQDTRKPAPGSAQPAVRKSYRAPRLVTHGSVRELTQSLRGNVFSDGTFGSSSLG